MALWVHEFNFSIFLEKKTYYSQGEKCPIRVPKVPFPFFDKLKCEIRKKVLIFVSMLKLRQRTSK